MFVKVITSVLILCLALFTVVCGGGWTSANASWLTFAAKTGMYAVLFGLAWYLYAYARPVSKWMAGRQETETKYSFARLRWKKEDIRSTALFLAAVYLLYLIVYYPGVCNADTANQLRDLITGMKPLSFQWYGGLQSVSASLNDHHPVFDTLVFGFFYQIGLLTGHDRLGILLYNLCQIAGTAFAFSMMLCVMDRLNVPLWIRRTGLIYLACMPFIGMYVINMMKDPLYSMFFVFYFVEYILLIKEEPTRGRLVRLIVFSLLLALTKKTGIYLVIIANALLLSAPRLRKKAAWLAVSILAPAILLFVIMGKILFPALQVYPGGKQEAIGLPLQQVAQAVIDHPDEISEQDKAIIDAVIDYEAIPEAFDPTVQDGIKKLFYFDTEDADAAEFLKLWLRWVPRYPISYLKASVWLTGGYFHPKGHISVYRELTQRGPIKWTNPQKLSMLRNIANLIYGGLRIFPLTSVFFRLVVYVWWIPLYVFFYLLKRKRYLDCLCFVPIILSVGVLIVCPYTAARYALSQLYVIPLIIGMGYTKE